MKLSCGIIGLPNVGKSTLFNALTSLNVKAENFPFCTIDPNFGIVSVPHPEIDQLSKIFPEKSVVNTKIKFIDIAGLIQGSHTGIGLGNRFLKNIREAKILIHVIRCFYDKNVLHVNKTIYPEKDVQIVNDELSFSDLELCEKEIFKLKKRNIRNTENRQILSILEKCLFHLNQGKILSTLLLSKEEKNEINHLNFLTLKPTIYIANVGCDNQKIFSLKYLKKSLNVKNSFIIPICVKKKIFPLNEKTLKSSGKSKMYFSPFEHVVRMSYDLLNLKTFFTIGKKEIRAWSLSKYENALCAAEKIHSDIKKGFIRAEIISFSDFVKHNGKKEEIKKLGKIRYEGKNYKIQHGDIIHFLFQK